MPPTTVIITFPATAIRFPDGIAFSNGTTAAEESIIDKIRAAKGQGSLNFVVNNTGTEPVELIDSMDLSAGGWVLDAGVSSPDEVIFDGGGRVIDLTGAASGSPLITVKNITFKGLTEDTTTGEANNTAPVILVDGGSLVMGTVRLSGTTPPQAPTATPPAPARFSPRMACSLQPVVVPHESGSPPAPLRNGV
jgi:hypothetical protein